MITNLVRRVRRNHGLEHATVAVLLERGMRPPLGGYSTAGGFLIFGRASTEFVTHAVREALDKLREGQRELAVSRYCGTTLVTGALLAGFLSAVIMGRGRKRLQRIPVAALAVLCATLVSRPLGDALQRRYTTLADMDGLKIAEVKRVWAGPAVVHRVRTILDPVG